jgi:tRNA dimethylallyltransferase
MRAVAVVGPTATGKSALGLALAARFGGEIVACDSTAVYRGVDIGTDKVPMGEQRGIPHHLVDVADPRDTYSAARYGADAAAALQAIAARGRLPVIVGGTGFYYRALDRGLFPGPARHDALRARLERVAARRGVGALHRWLSRVDPGSGERIQPRDLKRIVRALEVYLVTGRPLSTHFAATTAPVPGLAVLPLGLTMPRDALRERVRRRVDAQFAAGVVAEVRRLVADGVPATAHALSGLVYRQVLELLDGERDEAATRALIVQENMRYARRQLAWFRQEPGVHWLEGPGERDAAVDAAVAAVGTFLR